MALNDKDIMEILKVTLLEGGPLRTEIELPTVVNPKMCGLLLADIVIKFAEYFEKRGGSPECLHIIMDMLLCVVNNHTNRIAEKAQTH